MEETIKRIGEYKPFEKLILKELWTKIEKTPKDGILRRFSGTYDFQNKRYQIYCDYKLTDVYLKLYKLQVESSGELIFTTEKPKEPKPITQEIYI